MTIPSPTVTPAGSPQSEKFRTLPVRMTTEFWARSVATILADPKTDTDCRQRLTGELQSIADAALAAGVEIDGLVNDAAPVSPPTSEPSHTPGPWKIVSTFNASDCHGKLLCSIEGAEFYLAEVWNDIGSKEEAAANARLISAAPDLFAACKALQSAWADGEVGDWRGALDDALTMADRAVRKAEGGAA